MSGRASLLGLALLCVACAAYGSFVPLQWRPIGWAEGLRLAAAIPVEPVWHVFNGDFFTNVLVFLPIGFFAAGAACGPEGPRDDRRSTILLRCRPVAAGSVLIGSAVLSALIELGQVYIRDRTPSWSDVYAQTLGGTAGAAFWMLVGVATLEWVGGTLRASSRQQRVFRLLGLYAAGWTAYVLLPTVFPHLAHPQLHLWTPRRDLSRLVMAGPLSIAALSALPVGAFAAILSARLRPRWVSALLVVAGLGLLVLADRVRQVSFIPADGHLASELAGFAIGWLLGGIWSRRAGRLSRAMLSLGLVGVLAVIALHYWAPFDFGVSAPALEHRIRVLYARAPFHRYYWLPPLVALSEVMTLLLLALGTNLLIALVLRGRQPVVSSRIIVLGTMLIFAVIEWGQLYLPFRRADPTDVLIAGVGAVMGAAIARVLDGSSPGEGAVT